jgi:hypothetical protein
MRLLDVAWLYLLVGLACAIAVLARSGSRTPRTVAHAAINVLLWPLWAPLTLSAQASAPPLRDRAAVALTDADPRVAEAVSRIAEALHEAVAATEGGALATVLPAAAATRILDEVARVAARHQAVRAMLNTAEHDPEHAAARVETLRARGDHPRALATARLHAENVARLVRLRDRDRHALEELAELAAALRTQVVLARFAGTAVDGASDIVGEVWARVEGLGEALDATTPIDAHA